MKKVNQVKHDQLGMNYSTASNRLVKDLLFNFIVTTGQNICFQCGEPMERSNFSIEHKTPWLHSENPVELYFDLSNISYSHLRCNVESARRSTPKCGTTYKYNQGCRCDFCRQASTDARRKYYNPQVRREKYVNTGH